MPIVVRVRVGAVGWVVACGDIEGTVSAMDVVQGSSPEVSRVLAVWSQQVLSPRWVERVGSVGAELLGGDPSGWVSNHPLDGVDTELVLLNTERFGPAADLFAVKEMMGRVLSARARGAVVGVVVVGYRADRGCATMVKDSRRDHVPGRLLTPTRPEFL